MAHKDDVLKKIMEKCGAKNIVASQVEGSFYSKEIRVGYVKKKEV